MEKEIILDQIQIALFPNNFDIASPSAVAAKLLKEEGLVNEEEIIINSYLPESAPGEINRIEAVKHDDPNVEIKISKSKISIFWNNKEAKSDFEISVSEITEFTKKIIKTLNSDLEFNRVGYIPTYYQKASRDELRKMYKDIFDLDELNFDRMLDLETKITLETDFDNENWKDVLFNKHLVFGTGFMNKEPDQLVALLNYDLNTRQNQDVKWKIDDIIDFIEEAYKKSLDKETIFAEVYQ